jgi:hypothetical protein
MDFNISSPDGISDPDARIEKIRAGILVVETRFNNLYWLASR